MLYHVLCFGMCDWGRLRCVEERSASLLQSQSLFSGSTGTDVLLLFPNILGEYAGPYLGSRTCFHSCKRAGTRECMCWDACIRGRNAAKRTSDAK